VFDPRWIAKRYATSWFLADVVSIVPFNKINPSLGALRMLKVVVDQEATTRRV
jgi:hypothetical protein